MSESEKKVYSDRIEYRDRDGRLYLLYGDVEYWEHGTLIRTDMRRHSNPLPLKYRYSRRDICGWKEITKDDIIERLSKFHSPDYAEKFVRDLNARPGVEISTGHATYKAEKEVAK
jgi:hypothetical protein